MDPLMLRRAASPSICNSHFKFAPVQSVQYHNRSPDIPSLRLAWRHSQPIFTSLGAASRFKQTRKVKLTPEHWRSEASLTEGAACDTSRRRNPENVPIDASSSSNNGAIQHANGDSVNGVLPAGGRIATPAVESHAAGNALGAVSESRPLPLHVQIAKAPTCITAVENFNWGGPQDNRGLLTQRKKEKILEDNAEEELLQGSIYYPDQKEANESGRASAGEKGLGIVEFLKDKNIFITGATGFLAKVLVEKILRVQPGVGQLYLLIKAKDQKTAKERLKREIVDAKLLKCLKKQYGNSYEDFMMKKLTPVVGNITQENLGLDINTMDDLASKLDVIVNSAASTTFDERYDLALNLNTNGPQRILELSKRCPQLQLLLHVSTAFVNGQRKGLVHERPFRMGQSIATEMFGEQSVPDLNVESELKLVEEKMNDVLAIAGSYSLEDKYDLGEQNGRTEKQLTQTFKDLGLKRAKLFGWQDTYVFTKAMGEMLIDSKRGQLPVVILRPSVVESSIREPFAGWMEGNRMMDPIILSYGKGQLTGFLVDPNGVLDVVPVDMVANAMLAAMAKHACKPGLEVYQVASSVINPLVFGELSRISHEHFTENPYVDNAGTPVKPQRMNFFPTMESFVESLTDQLNKLASSTGGENLNRRKNLILKAKEQATYLANLYKPYTFYSGRFDNSNTEKLYGELSTEEREMFRFDVREIDWENYIKCIHIPGLRKHVLKGRGTSAQS